MPPVSRGFHGRRRADADPSRLPPGQYATRDFPVLSAGPTPHTPLSEWTLTVDGSVGESRSWSWEELRALPAEGLTRDIHCVTKWSKFDTVWTGVSVDAIIAAGAEKGVKAAPFVVAVCDGGYTTNLPLADVTGGKAWVAVGYDNK